MRRFLLFTGRALLLRCPRCGGRGILRGWFSLRHSCPTCGLALERGESEDYWIGGYTVNLVAAELLGIGAIIAFIMATWPDVPWTLVEFGGVAVMIAIPIAFFPFSRTLWLAWDLLFRPSEKGDIATGS